MLAPGVCHLSRNNASLWEVEGRAFHALSCSLLASGRSRVGISFFACALQVGLFPLLVGWYSFSLTVHTFE